MNRALRGIGSLLVLGGIGLLAYVGITYARGLSNNPQVSTQGPRAQGTQIAARLGRHQNVAVPRVGRVTSAGMQAIRMVIPRIGVDSTVVQTPPIGGIWPVAAWAVGHLSTTPGPGQLGNGAYAAHDDIMGEIFKRNGELVPGDVIFLYTRHMAYRYVVTGQETVDPSNVSVLAPTPRSTITLVSCTPYWVDANRLIVKAILKSSSAA
jgi:LPXTG-site transpeptidase (sortase) family protein